MKGEWKQPVGPPSSVGGIVGSTAVDHGNVYGPIVPAGYLWSLTQQAGTPRWASPVADGAHWGNPVSTANGVVYTVDLKGFLDAYDAATGAPLLARPMAADIASSDPVASWGGVSIARNTVYAAVGITGLSNGYVVGYRPSTTVSVPDPPSPPPLPGPSGGSGASTVVAGPEAQFYGYATPAMVVPQGGDLQFSNVDLVRHNVVQDPATDGVAGDGTAPWCGGFPTGACPLFYAPLQGLGESTLVQGVSGLKPGTYTFYCAPHPGMRGTLVVQ
jgi:plastocyanin